LYNNRWPTLPSYFSSFLDHFPFFKKIKQAYEIILLFMCVSVRRVGVSACETPFHQRLNAWTDLCWKVVCIPSHLGHQNGILHKSHPSVIPTLQPLKLYCFIDIMHIYWIFFSACHIRYSKHNERKVGNYFFPELVFQLTITAAQFLYSWPIYHKLDIYYMDTEIVLPNLFFYSSVFQSCLQLSEKSSLLDILCISVGHHHTVLSI
jgi:hypothetical protein